MKRRIQSERSLLPSTPSLVDMGFSTASDISGSPANLERELEQKEKGSRKTDTPTTRPHGDATLKLDVSNIAINTFQGS